MSTSSKLLYIKSNILPLPKLFEFEIAKIIYFYKLICYLRFLITTFHILNPAILVPQDFHLIITLLFLCLKVIELKDQLNIYRTKNLEFHQS